MVEIFHVFALGFSISDGLCGDACHHGFFGDGFGDYTACCHHCSVTKFNPGENGACGVDLDVFANFDRAVTAHHMVAFAVSVSEDLGVLRDH